MIFMMADGKLEIHGLTCFAHNFLSLDRREPFFFTLDIPESALVNGEKNGFLRSKLRKLWVKQVWV